LLKQLREMRGAIDENHRLAGARHAVDDTMALPQSAGQAFLLDVHHANQVGDGVLQQRALLGRCDADLRKEMPAQPLDLRQRQRFRELPREHLPQPLLKPLLVDGGAKAKPTNLECELSQESGQS
jgi:hypothetical protein